MLRLRVPLLLIATGFALAVSCDESRPPVPPDGGVGCPGVGLPCEKTAGVCAGKQRTCVDGSYEAICGPASYGPTYREEDLLCDGLDNDCDGFVDVGVPRLIRFQELHNLHRWRTLDLVGTDAGRFLAFESDGRPWLLEADGVVLASPPPNHLSVELGPLNKGVAFAFAGGFRFVQRGVGTLYAFDYSNTGAPTLAPDGSIRASVIAWFDAGSIDLYPSSAIVSPDSRVLYTYGVGVLPPYPHLTLLEPDGGLVRQVRIDRPAYSRFAARLSDGGFVASDLMPLGGTSRICATRWSSELETVDGGEVVIERSFGSVAGWTYDSEPAPALVLTTWDGPPRVELWHPFSGGSLEPWYSGASYGDEIHDATLANGHERLLLGVRRSEPPLDAGRESLVALLRDGGTKELAEWEGYYSYRAPSTVIIDEQRALTVFGYPGPQSFGYYSLMFCR